MAVIRPFRALTPVKEKAALVAALPYDVYNREEAREVVEKNPLSFLAIDRAETQFPEEQDIYAPCVYAKAASMLREWQERGIFEEDSRPCFYIWELIMNGRSQKGLVACSSVDDYLNNVIRKHENTRKDKEKDRFDHIDACSAQTGPIFLAYRSHPEIKKLIAQESMKAPVLDFVAEDGVIHRVWRIDRDDQIAALTKAFAALDHTYIADGHHRAASAVSVSLKRRKEHPDYTGREEFNYFLSVLFPDDELQIMDYNRVLKDLNGYEPDEILEKLDEVFRIAEAPESPYRPAKKGEMGLYLEGKWYRLQTRKHLLKTDPIGCLDVEYLQREALGPIWNIQDPRTDARIDFVGGIRGLRELERRCHEDCEAAFALYPTSISELFAVADAGLLMPPKSTWFEPKLRSGLFIHKIEK
ncbi:MULTISPECIES: DUF1015 domain-containing protein [unclassified Bilifractor]|uniref:DUF1015 domain-containing protein n=1 Tax=unclassified Bilifractor TaxID=2815795 RepID=UPI003F8FA993